MSDQTQQAFSIPVALAAQRLTSEQFNLGQLITSLYARISIESGTCGIFNQGGPGAYNQPNMGLQPMSPSLGLPPNFLSFASSMKKLDMTPEKINELTEKLVAIQKDIIEILK